MRTISFLPCLYRNFVLYDIDDCIAPESNERIREVWVNVIAAKFGLPREIAYRQILTHFTNHGCSATGFAQEYGLPPEWVESIYADCAILSGANFTNNHTPNPRLPLLTGQLTGLGYGFGTLTQGHFQHANPILTHLGLDPFIPHCYRFDRIRLNAKSKKTPVPYEQFIRETGIAPTRIIMVEDTPANLLPAAALGMCTILVGPRSHMFWAPHVHRRFTTAEDFLAALLAHPHLFE